MSCDHTTKDCDCCEGDLPAPKLYNRPSLPALRYRIGEYGHFYQRMIGELHKRRVPELPVTTGPPLQALTTREKDDHAIGLIDAWAVTCDVLTFYQERIANEGFLRTATERRSILDLAAEIGYELSPGVAAETDLAFQVEEIKNQSEEAPITMPDRFPIPAGTQVQSMPQGSDELPQTFETLADFEARPAWNILRPRSSWTQHIPISTDRVWLDGVSLNLKVGQRIVLVPASGGLVARTIQSVEELVRPDGTKVKTLVIFSDGTHPPVPENVPLVAVAPEAHHANTALTSASMGRLLGLVVSEAGLQEFIRKHHWSEKDLLTYANRAMPPSMRNFKVHVMREKCGVLGNNAVHYDQLSDEVKGKYVNWGSGKYWGIWKDPMVQSGKFVFYTGGRLLAAMGISGLFPDPDASAPYFTTAQLFLERVMDKVVIGSYIILDTSGKHLPYKVSNVVEMASNAFAISTKTTGLTLEGLDDPDSGVTGEFKIHNTVVHCASEPMLSATRPDMSGLEASTIRLDLDTMVLGLSIGQIIIIKGERSDAANITATERHVLNGIFHHGGRTILVLKEGLKHSYKRSTVKIMANVVRASHGERAKQVIGSGDGAATHQHITLNKPKLTHLTAPNSTSGRTAALTVRVDGVAWTQVPSLYQQPAASKVYTVRVDDDAKAHVRFGDGKMGARVPTGQINIEAEYRSGIGLAGEVGAATLTLLKSRPYGVKSVTNPLAADDAEDPEQMENARANAPLTVRTLDRVVSLPDYEDFAAAFPSIGKTQAVELWNGHQELVHVTVLDTTGDRVSYDQLINLRTAIERFRDPNRRFVCENGDVITFDLNAEVLIDPAYRWADVESALRTILLDAFSYAQRGFGQPVSAAEVVERMHLVKGVVAVDVNALRTRTSTKALNAVLPSRIATYNTDRNIIIPAAMLLINSSGITLTPMTDAA